MEDELYNMKKVREDMVEIINQYLFEFDTTETRNEINHKMNSVLARYNVQFDEYNDMSEVRSSSDFISEIEKRIEILERNNKIDNILRNNV